MSAELLLHLQWLPQPPADFNQRLQRLVSAEQPAFASGLRHLASHALSENQLIKVARALASAVGAGVALDALAAFKLGILSNATTEQLAPALVASALRHGIALSRVSGAYGQTLQEATNPESEVMRARPDAVLLAIDYRGLPLRCAPGDEQQAAAACAASLGYLNAIREGIRRHSGALCILQTIVAPPEALFGNLDRAVPGTPQWLAAAFNQALADSVHGTPDVLLDVAALAGAIGVAEWHCPRHWNLGKFPFAQSCLPLYADHVARVVAALRGKSRRCLILDLDNTIWGGVIGDDGLEGIVLAQGDATGEAHLELQRLALDLRQRGVVLTVCSKNDESNARAPFRSHPDMLLKEQHIAVFRANWHDKAANIRAIADELSLGLESMVFVDDNPVERGLVRELLPQVAVPEMPQDPAYYARTLAAAGYFEAIAFSNEDRQRADNYQQQAGRAALLEQSADLDSYLASLEMQITFSPFDATGRARIAQLINKSNQYNLTTRRYTEAQVAEAESDPGCFTLQVRVADRFGDNGMISVVICRTQSDHVWEIDTWLMSCRVLGRRVEHLVLGEVVTHAIRRGIRRLRGRYVPTDRNQLVADHYSRLGFERVDGDTSGASEWALAVDDTPLPAIPAAITRTGFAAA